MYLPNSSSLHPSLFGPAAGAPGEGPEQRKGGLDSPSTQPT
ncbi:hypothetical protein OHT52_30025 [Streptomyces sp. NBC_00247]|nr:hypothetical protein [Streptomyces sp. NBC_00247]